MRPILIDTNAYTAFKKGDKSILEILQYVEKIGVSPIVVGELLGGFDNGTKSKQNRKELSQFLATPRIEIYPLTYDTANFYSHVYSSLKRKVRPIPTNDMWIAAQALENGCIVCTHDKHFHEIEGILVASSVEDLMIEGVSSNV